MMPSGFYRDPLKRHFSRFFTGHGWTYKVRDSDGKEQSFFDSDLSDEFLRWLDPPVLTDLIEAIDFEVLNIPNPEDETEVDVSESLIAKFEAGKSENLTNGDGWIQGFNSRVRLVDDVIEILIEPEKKRTTLFLSSNQDLLNAGLRTIPLRTVQAVHLVPAHKGLMGTLQFTVPGSLTHQYRDSAGKALRLLGGDSSYSTSQAHENSVTFELSQQDSFESFHKLIVNRLSQLGLAETPTKAEAPDYVARIRELKQLFDEGALTEDEFETAKKVILSKI